MFSSVRVPWPRRSLKLRWSFSERFSNMASLSLLGDLLCRSGSADGINGRMKFLARILQRPQVQVGLGFVLADVALMVLMHRGAFSRSRGFALGLIFGVNLGAFLYWRVLRQAKPNLPN